MIEKIKKYQADIYVSSHSGPMDRSTFFREVLPMELITEAIKENITDKEEIISFMQDKMKCKLNRDDLELVEWFENGLFRSDNR